MTTPSPSEGTQAYTAAKPAENVLTHRQKPQNAAFFSGWAAVVHQAGAAYSRMPVDLRQPAQALYLIGDPAAVAAWLPRCAEQATVSFA